MTDIEQRAHDFAIAAVNAYQAVENTKHSIIKVILIMRYVNCLVPTLKLITTWKLN